MALGAAGVAHDDASLWYRVKVHLGLRPGPDLEVPVSGARIFEGSFESGAMKGQVGWAYSLPARAPARAIVVCLYGKDGDQHSVFDQLHLPDMAAHVGAPLAIASAYGGADSYWHKRADGTDAHAMVVDEFVPMLRRLIGDLPLALYGYSMGGYGALLAAQRARRPDGANEFEAAAVASPALWERVSQTHAGAFDGPADFAANDVFSRAGELRSLSVRLDCGDLDPFYGATLQLSEVMTWPHVAVFTPGAAHTVGFWRSVAPPQMRFLAQACGVPLA